MECCRPATGVVTASSSRALDVLGAGAGLLCAVHCAAVVALPSVLTALGLGVLLGHAAEWALVGCSLALLLVAGCLGFTRHRSRRVLWLFALAAALVLGGRLLEQVGGTGALVAVLGGCCVFAAHVMNLRARGRLGAR